MLDTFKTQADTDWFVHDRFGLFIHWGLYALPARHEWVKSKERISEEHYELYFKHFDPDLYDPELWAKAAADCGMKYFVITTKHHEGFCLWDSQHTDYKSTNTPCGKDLLRPMVDAFTGQGLRTGFYHSIIDWHHPQYWVDYKNHPRRDALPPADKESHGDWIKSATGKEYDGTDINAGRDQAKYAEYLYNQVEELLTTYKNVDALWFDFSFPDKDEPDNFMLGKGRKAWDSEKLVDMIRKHAPGVILTDRLDLKDRPLSGGDMITPEQNQPLGWVHVEHQGKKVPVVWEACQTFSGSWGYYRDEHDWRSVRQLIFTLIDCVSKGGNLLLNVGPTGRGEFDARALDRMQGIGQWMKRHSRSIYGCTQAPAEFECPENCKLTYNAEKKRLYVHLLNWPYKALPMPGKAYQEQVEYAQLLNDASEVKLHHRTDFDQLGHDPGPITMARLPQMEPQNVEIPVIELMLK